MKKHIDLFVLSILIGIIFSLPHLYGIMKFKSDYSRLSSNIKLIHNKIVKFKLIPKNKIFIFLLLLISAALIFYLFRNSKNREDQKEIHYHAGFLVYLNGVRQDFSGSQYMHIEPCSEENEMQHSNYSWWGSM